MEEELLKADAELADVVGDVDTNVVTIDLWGDLQIDCEETLGAEEPEDIQLTAV